MDKNVERLHEAIENRDEQLIKTLIENGVDLKARNDRGMNSLHLAVERSYREIVNQLLKADKSLVNEVVVTADRESDDIVGYTALHFSAKLTDTKIADSLLRSGGKLEVVDRNLRKPLHVAVLYGNVEGVNKLLYHNDSVNEEDCEGKTAFMYAVESYNVNILKLMIRWADKEICKSYAKAIIEFTSDSRCVEFVQLLLHDKIYQVYYNIMLIELLQCAIVKKHIYIIDNLLLSMNILLDNTRTIATVVSVNKTNIEVAEFLMKNDYIIKFVDLEAAFHFAVLTNSNNIFKIYLQGVNVDCKDVNGDSLSYMTCFKNNLDAAKKCIALGCDVNAHNCFGETALHAAVTTANPELVVLLKKSGCDLNAKNNYLKTPFEFLLQNNCHFHHLYSDLSSDMIECKHKNVIRIAKMLLKPGMDLTCHENDNECVLLLAVKTGIVELVKIVIQHHPSLDHLDKQIGNTCMHVAAEYNYVDVMKLLLQSGAKPDVYNNWKEVPITIALRNENEKLVALLANYSNLNAITGSCLNETMIHLAVRKNNKEIISALVFGNVDLHAKYISGRTALCYVSADECESIYQHLLNVGFDVNFGYHEYLETCSCWIRFYTKRFAKIHVLKLHLIEHVLQPFLSSLIENAEIEFQDVYLEIREEAKRLMSSFIPDTEIPFTDIIKSDDEKLAIYARNESVVKVFKDVDSLRMEWPHYWQILIARMTKGFVRRRFLDKCYVIFNSVDRTTEPVLLLECVDMILDQLKTSELHKFIASFPFVDTSQYDPPFLITNTVITLN